jgi:hypothetical protein
MLFLGEGRQSEVYAISLTGIVAAIAALATRKRPQAQWVSAFTQGVWAVGLPGLAWLAPAMSSWYGFASGRLLEALVFQLLGFVAGAVASVLLLVARARAAAGSRRPAAGRGLLIPVLGCSVAGWLLWTGVQIARNSDPYLSPVPRYLLLIVGTIVAAVVVAQAFRLADRGQGCALVAGWSVAAVLLLLIFNTYDTYYYTTIIISGKYSSLTWVALALTVAAAVLAIVDAARKDAGPVKPTA